MHFIHSSTLRSNGEIGLKFLRLSISTLALVIGPSCLAQRVLGTDVSGYQPANINWSTATNKGVRFAWSKATEGTGYVNPNFVSQVNGAVAAKVYVGAYHFARPSSHPNITGGSSADSEATYFWSTAGNYIKFGGAYCVPMLDWEDTGMTNQLSAATLSSWVIEWCNAVSNLAYNAGVPGLRPAIYTGAWYSKPSSTYSGLTTAVTNFPAWISYYPYGNSTVGFGTPNPLTDPLPSSSSCFPWTACQIWQYGDTNWTGGDADVTAGNLSQFVQTFVIGGTNAPVLTTQPTNQFVLAGYSASFAVKATGQTPMSFLWKFNGSNIPGATSSNYTVVNVQSANVGQYLCMVSNAYAVVPSSAVYATILTNPPGAVPAPTGMVDWWAGEGTPADLLSQYTGNPTGGLTYVSGKRAKAFHFDGTTSYLVTGAPSLAVPWTMCMWVNREQSSATAAALSGDGANELKLEQYNATHQVGFTIFGVGDYNFGYTAPQAAWTHLAFVASGTQMQLYANGALMGTITTNCPCPRGYIGAGYVNSNGHIVDYLKGGLDEVQVFNRALSSTEINTIYNAGSGGVVDLPLVVSKFRNAPGQFRISAQGLPNRTISVWSSTNLVDWNKLTSLSYSGGTTIYTDTHATNYCQYYRLAQP
jgi:GH25 family lysozyme M1 (1,4-beta-N-acetylmuramidase)